MQVIGATLILSVMIWAPSRSIISPLATSVRHWTALRGSRGAEDSHSAGTPPYARVRVRMRLHMRNNAGAASAAEVLYEPKKRRQIVPVSTAGAVNDSAAQLVGLQLRRRPFMQPPPQGPGRCPVICNGRSCCCVSDRQHCMHRKDRASSHYTSLPTLPHSRRASVTAAMAAELTYRETSLGAALYHRAALPRTGTWAIGAAPS